MQDSAQSVGFVRGSIGSFAELLHGIGSHTDEADGTKSTDETYKMTLTCKINLFRLSAGELGGRDVCSALAHPY